MKKIIVTGASGFIGKACIRILQSKNFEIHAISSKKKSGNGIHWHQIDLNVAVEVQDFCKKIKAKYLLHLAWNVSDKQYDDNQHYSWVGISINLVDAFAKHGGKRLVVSGTCAEYDWNYEHCTEQYTPIRPHNAYSVSKNALFLLLDSYTKLNKISFAWGRIFFAYGPYRNSNNLIQYLINNLRDNKPVVINQGSSIRDYIYIDDIADAFITILETDLQGAINISSNIPTKIKDIVLNIANYFKNEHLVTFTDNESVQYSCIVGDNSRLQNELHWQPKICINEGLERTIKSLL